ncbi:MAG: hypothetical protein IKO72_08640 [Kiritimatiellae bacterium]|nr:hypothetical protein [Kiritimatiellia bacterium]
MTPRADRIFAGALADLDGRLGVKLADMEPGEIAALVRACDREANPWRDADADAAGVPVRVCDGVWFWRPTIGAAAWLEEVAGPLMAESAQYRACLIYALVHAREPEAFRDLDTPSKIRRAATRAALSIAATPQEVDRAIEKALGMRNSSPSDADISDAAAGWANIAARLESQTGIPASEWIWKRSSAYAMKCYTDLSTFARAYGGGRHAPVREMLDELDEAVAARQRLKVKIARRVKETREAKDGDR